MGKGSHAKQTEHGKGSGESARAAGQADPGDPADSEDRRADDASDAGNAADDGEALFLPPLRPRPRLVIGLSVVLALWVAFLLFLYFHTVYPERQTTDPRPAAPLPSETSKR